MSNARVRATLCALATTVAVSHPALSQVPDPDTIVVLAAMPTEVVIEWSSVDDAALYEVQRRTPDADWVRLKEVSASITLFRDHRDLRPGETYQYRVIAKANGEASEGMRVVTVDTPTRAGERRTNECYLAATRGERPDCSYVMVSAIRSVAGRRPPNEWFSLQFKFSGNETLGPTNHRRFDPRRAQASRRFFSFFYADVNLSPGVDDDPTDGNDNVAARDTTEVGVTDFFNDATFAVNFWVGNANNSYRGTFLGAVAKVFDQVPYGGLHIGGMERVESTFYGSYISFMPLAYTLNDAGGGNRLHSFMEFSLRSDDGPAFFQTFAARGGVLLPWDRARDASMRIVLLVPVGGVFAFR